MSQLKEQALSWLKKFHTASDARNAEPWIKNFFTEDAILYFGNNPPVQGQENLIQMFDQQFAVLDLMKHDVSHVDVLPDRLYQYAMITYRVKGDNESVRIPGLAVFHKTPTEEKVRQFDVFIDTSPLTERIKTIFPSN